MYKSLPERQTIGICETHKIIVFGAGFVKSKTKTNTVRLNPPLEFKDLEEANHFFGAGEQVYLYYVET